MGGGNYTRNIKISLALQPEALFNMSGRMLFLRPACILNQYLFPKVGQSSSYGQC